MTRNTHDVIFDHRTSELDTTKFVRADGAGGVVFDTPASGGGPGVLNPANVIGPFTLTANTDNWAPTGLLTANVIKVDLDADHNLTGISAVYAAQWSLALLNVSFTYSLTLKNEDSNSTGFNQFSLPGLADLVIPPQGGVILYYDAAEEFWYVLQVLGTGGGGGGTWSVDVQQILVTSGSYTWTKPANAIMTEVILIGGGGGGGGGGNESSGALGGAGGGGGGMSRRLFRSSDLGVTEVTEPGQGGSGGSAGSAGTTGGNSYFGADHLTNPKDAKLTAGGGIGGVAGVAGTTRQNGSPPGFGNQASAVGRWDRNAPTTQQYLPFFSGGSPAEPLDLWSDGSSDYYCGGGGAGGSISTGTSPRNGGKGGAPVEQGGGNSGNNGPISGYSNGGTTGASQDATAGHTITTQALYYGGYGGGGGAGRHQSSSRAGNGGAGSIFGGGGGGGGAGNTALSVTAGAGGDGAHGVVVVITYCFA